MEIPRHWRLRGERLRGPGQPNDSGSLIVNGKIFNPETGELSSPIEWQLRFNQKDLGLVAVGVMGLAEMRLVE